MTREIKFRAWVKPDKAMIQHREVIERAHLQFNDSLNASDAVMQFTGLHDKDGKEIYEGDIVKSFDEILTVFFNPHTAAFEVMFDYPKGDCEPIGVNEHSTLEVIGNVYENPELLNQPA